MRRTRRFPQRLIHWFFLSRSKFYPHSEQTTPKAVTISQRAHLARHVTRSESDRSRSLVVITKAIRKLKGEAMSNRKAIICVTLVVVSIAASVIVLATNHKTPAVPSADKNTPPSSKFVAETNVKANASATPQLAQAVGPAQMVRFTVYDEGIRPAVAHVSPGLVAIYLDDKSTHTASLLLANDQHPLGTISRQVGKLRGHSTILLTTGRYTIYEANRRNSAATLIVAP